MHFLINFFNFIKKSKKLFLKKFKRLLTKKPGIKTIKVVSDVKNILNQNGNEKIIDVKYEEMIRNEEKKPKNVIMTETNENQIVYPTKSIQGNEKIIAV